MNETLERTGVQKVLDIDPQDPLDPLPERKHMSMPGGRPISLDKGVGWVEPLDMGQAIVTTHPDANSGVDDGNRNLLHYTLRGQRLWFEVMVQRTPDGKWRVFRTTDDNIHTEIQPRVYKAEAKGPPGTSLQKRTVVNAILDAMTKFYDENAVLFAEAALAQRNNAVLSQLDTVKKKRQEALREEEKLRDLMRVEDRARVIHDGLKVIHEVTEG